MPVHECSIRVFLPGPHMQSVERRQSEAIRSIEEVEKLSHKLWRVRMRFVPCIGENQKVGSDQLEAAVRHRLVDDDLGTSRVENAHAHQICVYVMEAHGSRIGAAYAPELQDIPLSHRGRDSREHLPGSAALCSSDTPGWSGCANARLGPRLLTLPQS